HFSIRRPDAGRGPVSTAAHDKGKDTGPWPAPGRHRAGWAYAEPRVPLCSGSLADAELKNPPIIRARHVECIVAQHRSFAGIGQVADLGSDEAADGVVFLVGECGVELDVEILDGRQR